MSARKKLLPRLKKEEIIIIEELSQLLRRVMRVWCRDDFVSRFTPGGSLSMFSFKDVSQVVDNIQAELKREQRKRLTESNRKSCLKWMDKTSTCKPGVLLFGLVLFGVFLGAIDGWLLHLNPTSFTSLIMFPVMSGVSLLSALILTLYLLCRGKPEVYYQIQAERKEIDRQFQWYQGISKNITLFSAHLPKTKEQKIVPSDSDEKRGGYISIKMSNSLSDPD